MTPDVLLQEINKAMIDLVPEGAANRLAGETIPQLSHLCFKFKSEADYRATIESAQHLGVINHKEFGGKEITWCRLNAPILSLEWLELVQPKTESNAYNGLTAIGYAVPELATAVKIQSADGKITFRYQPKHAAQLAQ
jgi:hypothetical protein